MNLKDSSLNLTPKKLVYWVYLRLFKVIQLLILQYYCTKSLAQENLAEGVELVLNKVK